MARRIQPPGRRHNRAILFCTTEQARANLLAEEKKPEQIYVTGNTGIDALRTTIKQNYSHPDLAWADGSRLILVTAHRRENLVSPCTGCFALSVG